MVVCEVQTRTAAASRSPFEAVTPAERRLRAPTGRTGRPRRLGAGATVSVGWRP